MKYTCLIIAIVSIALFSISAHSQIRQTHLYIDDGHGHFSILSAPSGGGSITLPDSGTIQSSSGTIVVSNESDTAKSLNTVIISGSTAVATIVNNGSTTDVAASVSAGTPGQILYIFNNLGSTHNVTFKGLSIGQGLFGIFMYLAGDWRVLAVPAVA